MSIDPPSWPGFNASLNTASAILLLFGYVAIRKGLVKRHTALMLSACGTSLLFLISYLIYHYVHGSTPFLGKGLVRIFYFTMLGSHTVLAVVVLPLVAGVLYHAFKGQIDRHRALARVTLPIWFYVSVTGVLVYLMLYQGPW
jgi:putative membrane protein